VYGVCKGYIGVGEALRINGKVLGKEEVIFHELGHLLWETIMHR